MSYEVLAVRYATREGTRRESFHGYLAYDEPDGPLVMDYFFWILRGPDGKVTMVDCGFDDGRSVHAGMEVLIEPAEALALLGVEPEAVELVIITHLHYDHTGNLDLFPNAEFAVAERDLEFWTGPLADRIQFASHANSQDVEFVDRARREGRVRLLGEDEEILPGVRALRVGGHSPGQLVLVVDGPGQGVVLTSDTIHYYEELELDRPFAVVSDLAEMYRAYEVLRDLVGSGDRVLVAGHDPLVAERFPAAPGGDGLVLSITGPTGGE